MKILKYQHWHLALLLILLYGVYFCLQYDPRILQGELWGIATPSWIVIAILSPIIHQLYVLFCWRAELLHQSLSKALGQNAFKLFKAGFALLILSRLVTISLLAIASSNTLDLEPATAYTIAGILFLPTAYLFYSVKKYFGPDRAMGIDHFQPEALKYVPFVKKGIFQYTPNAMYVFGLLILWIPGFLLMSKAALLVALFNHLYIWVHYYFTEKPDMKYIYAD